MLIGFVWHLGSTEDAVILEQFEIQASVLARGREEASSQVRDDPKSGSLACICKCFLYELLVAVNICMI